MPLEQSQSDIGIPRGGTSYELRVLRVIPETADARSIVFEIPAELQRVFRYEAGQFVTLKIPYEGRELSRCYSLASSPDWDREHKVTVKRFPGGRISNWINDCLREGDRVRVSPPGGAFVLNGDTNPLFMFAGGSGITPVISLIKTALATSDRAVKLVYANSDEDSIIFKAELEELATSWSSRLQIAQHLDSHSGFLADSSIAARVEGVLDSEFYICGPGPFMDTIEASLLRLGVAPSRLHFERFVSPPDPSPSDDVQVATLDEVAPEAISVMLDGRTHRLPYEPGRTILATVQSAGLEPPFSCTEGFCGCCMAKLRAGRVRMIRNDFLSERELEEGWVLTCQSIPVSVECGVEYPD